MVQIIVELEEEQKEELKKLADGNCRSMRSEAKFAILEYIRLSKETKK